MLQVKHIYKSFGKNEVLTDISFELKAGEIVAYLGQNGAGKTTTIKAICGLNNIDKGNISINENQIGVVFDHNGLYTNLTAYENLLLFIKLRNVISSNSLEIDGILDVIGLSAVKNKKVGT